MLHRISLTLAIIILFFLNGCATLSKSECNKGEWSKIGSKDARQGLRAPQQLRHHNSACSKHNIRPNNKSYFSGYSIGLKTYCTRKEGFRFGSKGKEYFDVCPVSLKQNFLNGYLAGLELNIDEIQRNIDDLRYEKRKKRRKLKSLLSNKEKDKNKGTDKENKKHKSVKKLKEKLDDLQSEISSERSKRNKLQAWYSSWSR